MLEDFNLAIQLFTSNPFNGLYLLFLIPGIFLIFYFRNTKYGKYRQLDFSTKEVSLTVLASFLISTLIVLSSAFFASAPIFILSSLIVFYFKLINQTFVLQEPIATIFNILFVIIFVMCYVQVFRYVLLKTKENGEILKNSIKVSLSGVGAILIVFSFVALLSVSYVILVQFFVSGFSINTFFIVISMLMYGLFIILIPFILGGFMFSQHFEYIKILKERLYGSEMSSVWSLYYKVKKIIDFSLKWMYKLVDMIIIKSKPIKSKK